MWAFYLSWAHPCTRSTCSFCYVYGVGYSTRCTGGRGTHSHRPPPHRVGMFPNRRRLGRTYSVLAPGAQRLWRRAGQQLMARTSCSISPRVRRPCAGIFPLSFLSLSLSSLSSRRRPGRLGDHLGAHAGARQHFPLDEVQVPDTCPKEPAAISRPRRQPAGFQGGGGYCRWRLARHLASWRV